MNSTTAILLSVDIVPARRTFIITLSTNKRCQTVLAAHSVGYVVGIYLGGTWGVLFSRQIVLVLPPDCNITPVDGNHLKRGAAKRHCGHDYSRKIDSSPALTLRSLKPLNGSDRLTAISIV